MVHGVFLFKYIRSAASSNILQSDVNALTDSLKISLDTYVTHQQSLVTSFVVKILIPKGMKVYPVCFYNVLSYYSQLCLAHSNEFRMLKTVQCQSIC